MGSLILVPLADLRPPLGAPGRLDVRCPTPSRRLTRLGTGCGVRAKLGDSNPRGVQGELPTWAAGQPGEILF
jgi:hypothetical protein